MITLKFSTDALPTDRLDGYLGVASGYLKLVFGRLKSYIFGIWKNRVLLVLSYLLDVL